MGRTNGIALSPDGTTLYLTEARGSPVSSDTQSDGQRIWKYSVAPDGSVSQKTVFFNFATDANQPEASTDSDGMRTDASGNLYVTRNGLGKVAVITPAGSLLREIQLSKTNFPTNLAFSPTGDLLYVVGRCGNAPYGTGDGCMDVVRVAEAPPTPAPQPTQPPTPAPTAAPTPGPTSEPCTDDNQYCESWAANGECEANPGYMLVSCRKSCGVCSGPGPQPTPTPPTQAPTTAPTPPPTPAPTSPPTAAPTPATGPSCCKWASSCSGGCASGWCSSSQANCGGCGGTWCAPSLLSTVERHEA